MARLAEQRAFNEGLTGPQVKSKRLASSFDMIVYSREKTSRKGGFDRMTDQLRDPAAGRRQEIMNSMQSELELALTFVNVSSIAYGRGKLQRAIDAHSRAEALYSRAIAELIESATPDPEASHSVQSKLDQVRHALAHLPSSSERIPRVKRVG